MRKLVVYAIMINVKRKNPFDEMGDFCKKVSNSSKELFKGIGKGMSRSYRTVGAKGLQGKRKTRLQEWMFPKLNTGLFC